MSPASLSAPRTVGCLAGLLALSLPVGARAAGPDVTDAQVPRALPRLAHLARDALKKTGVPGLAIAVVHRDRVVHLAGFGVRAAGTQAAVDADTVFQIASVSKPITSTVLAALVGAKVIGW